MSTGHGAVALLSGWEDNRRSGITLAMRHRLCDRISIYGFHGLRKGDEYPEYTPYGHDNDILYLSPYYCRALTE